MAAPPRSGGDYIGAIVGIDGVVNARLPLAAAIVIVLAAGATLAVIRPGDLDVGDETAAAGPPSPSTTTPDAAAPAPTTTPDAAAPAPTTTPDAAAPAPTTTATVAPTPSTTAATPTSVAAPVPPGGSDTTVSGGAGVTAPPRLADTGGSGRLMALGLGLVLAGVAACWSASRSHLLP
jgi:hypothetical protein